MKILSDNIKKEETNTGHDNPPNLPELSYRVGVYQTFLQRMLARLPTQMIPDGSNQGKRPLAALQTRDRDDPCIAVLDAWACALDVLSFYQERIANEGYLRTAKQRRSVLEMARTTGYELSPGVAASTYLAFTVEDAMGAPGRAVVPEGTQVQSVPGQDQFPQTFETEEEIEVRAEWNAMKPLLTEPQEIGKDTTEIYFKGIDTRLQQGDAILLIDDRQRWDYCIVQTVMPCIDYTLVTYKRVSGNDDRSQNPQVFAFRVRAALFGHNAPDWRVVPDEVKKKYAGDNYGEIEQWPNFKIQENQIDLDAVYPKILPDSWILFEGTYELIDDTGETNTSHTIELYKAAKVTTGSRTDFTLTAKITRIEPEIVEGKKSPTEFELRDTVVFAQSEELELAEKPVTEPVRGKEIVLDRLVKGLKPGQPVSVWCEQILTVGSSLQKQTDDDEKKQEVVFIDTISEVGGKTKLNLRTELENDYDRKSFAICANVVLATHGETVAREVLGSGDGTQTNQRFVLKKKPLTFVSSPDSDGTDSALEIRVNNVRWREVDSFYGQGPNDLCYMVRVNNEAAAEVIFGDGIKGARLPSGRENVVAVYRTGIGPEGEVDADSLTLLKNKPLGVRSVTNPLRANGAASPDTLELARANAPLALVTIDRLVSLRDFEDFARAFAGIGKAQAVVMWSGEARIIHITVADADGDPASKDLCDNLREAIFDRRDPAQNFEIDPYEQLFFNIKANVLVESDFDEEIVRDEITTVLRDSFTFDKRDFGQSVSASEIIAMIQAVRGVVAVDIDYLYLWDSDKTFNALLPAQRARWEGEDETKGADLLILNPDENGIILNGK